MSTVFFFLIVCGIAYYFGGAELTFLVF